MPAPKPYLSWLREADAAILDDMPDTKHFKKTQITQFLLEEADADLINRILDVSAVESNPLLASCSYVYISNVLKGFRGYISSVSR